MEAFNWYALVILPLLVFFARVLDVSLGMLRIILLHAENGGSRHFWALLRFLFGSLWSAR